MFDFHLSHLSFQQHHQWHRYLYRMLSEIHQLEHHFLNQLLDLHFEPMRYQALPLLPELPTVLEFLYHSLKQLFLSLFQQLSLPKLGQCHC